MLLFSAFVFFFKLRDTQISSKGHHCGYPDPEGYTYFGKLVQGGVVARDDRDGWGTTGPNMQDGVEVAAGPGQRGWGHALAGWPCTPGSTQGQNKDLYTPGVRTVVTKS